MRALALLFILAVAWGTLGFGPKPVLGESVPAASVPAVIHIPAGPFIMGSDQAEREAGYRLDEAAYGHDITRQRGWYDSEPARQTAETPAFAITTTLITNAQYAVFVAATGHPAAGRRCGDLAGLSPDPSLGAHPASRLARRPAANGFGRIIPWFSSVTPMRKPMPPGCRL